MRFYADLARKICCGTLGSNVVLLENSFILGKNGYSHEVINGPVVEVLSHSNEIFLGY